MKQKILILFAAIAFIFSSCEKDDEVLITKIEVKNVKIVPAYYSADISWKVLSDATISEVYVQYATDASFSKYQEIQMTSGGSDQYQTTITGLTDNTLYYIRCKAQNKINSHIGYSNNFTTKKKTTPTIDKVTANASYTSISCTANISDDGGQQITARGVCYATTSMPTTANPSIACGSGGGSYTCTIPNLTPETTYYIRAYAIYSGQTIYGSQNAYTTLALTTPTVTTASDATNITESSATISNNKVTDDGGLAVTSRGVCYSTSSTPTTANAFVAKGSGIGPFSCELKELAAGTKYYARAYATNSKGTSYGKEIFFKTLNISTITYMASAKLEEVTGDYADGLHTDAFDFPIYSHTFSNGTGTITFDGVITKIGEKAFYSCKNMTSVTIPNSVTSIGGYAFFACYGLTSVTIPNSVTTIDTHAFTYCANLISISVNSSNTAYSSLNGVLFSKNQTTLVLYPPGKKGSYTIPSGVTSIGTSAFYYCSNLTSITIPGSVTSIGDDAFYECSGLTSVTMSKGVISIGSSAFSFCDHLTSIAIPSSVTSIGDYAFNKCSGLTSVTIPNSVTSIGRSAFCGCSGLTLVNIPNRATIIGDYVFYGCSGLTSITIPNSVTTIGYMAFYSCSGLTSITCNATTPPTCGSHAFDGITKSIPVYVPASSVNAYKAATGWKDFTNIQPL